MELPLTEPCPECGAEMEPSEARRRGETLYVCPECGHEMPITDLSVEPDDEHLPDA